MHDSRVKTCYMYAHDYQDENSQKKVYHLKKYIQVTLGQFFFEILFEFSDILAVQRIK